MRKLRIVGVNADSSVVECEVPASGEKFSLPLDDRLRAAARGEFLAADSGDRTPVTGTLRPREIQERIRHGATAEEVATDAGVPLSRIEGFAVPVLLERATAADLAKNSHPMLPDGPSLDTLADRVYSALDRRGVDADLVNWDAWRDRSGNWVIRTSWPAGLSDDAAATWSFAPDSHGGSARALDEEAEGILDPSRATPLRPVASAPPLPSGRPPIRAVPAPEHDDDAAPGSGAAGAETPGGAATTAPQDPPVDPAATSSDGPAAVVPTTAASSTSSDSPGVGAAGAVAAGDPEPYDGRHPAPPSGRRAGGSTDRSGDNASGPDHSTASEADDEDFLRHPPSEPERRSSRRHPTMPSWEDVLLGVRSKDD